MSTAIRIIILVVEILAYIIVFLLKKSWWKKNECYSVYEIKKLSKAFLISLLGIALVTIFIFPKYVFLSYIKLITVFLLVIMSSMWFCFDKLRKIGFLSYLMLCVFIICIFFYSYEELRTQKPIDEEVQTFFFEEFEEIGNKNAKIAQVIDKDGKTVNYFFLYKDKDGVIIQEEMCPSEVTIIGDYKAEDAYVQKDVYTWMYTYTELKESPEKYTTEERTEYIICIDEKKQLIKVRQ